MYWRKAVREWHAKHSCEGKMYWRKAVRVWHAKHPCEGKMYWRKAVREWHAKHPCEGKMYWRKAVREWHAKHPGEVLNKVTLAPLLTEVIESAAKLETLVRSFQACGLCPLNANAVDYTKCLGKNAATRPRRTNENNGRADPCTIKRNEDTSMDYATFVNIVGKDKVEKFRRINNLSRK
jgi:hypothetical protein